MEKSETNVGLTILESLGLKEGINEQEHETPTELIDIKVVRFLAVNIEGLDIKFYNTNNDPFYPEMNESGITYLKGGKAHPFGLGGSAFMFKYESLTGVFTQHPDSLIKPPLKKFSTRFWSLKDRATFEYQYYFFAPKRVENLISKIQISNLRGNGYSRGINNGISYLQLDERSLVSKPFDKPRILFKDNFTNLSLVKNKEYAL